MKTKRLGKELRRGPRDLGGKMAMKVTMENLHHVVSQLPKRENEAGDIHNWKAESEFSVNAQGVNESDIDALFDALKNLYGNKFVSQWGLFDEQGVWLAELAHLNVMQLNIGYCRCKERLKDFVREGKDAWPPQPAEFAVLCELRPEDLGMPTMEEAWAEVCEKAHSPSNHLWSHVVVRLAARKVTWAIMHTSFDEIGRVRDRFSQEYLALVNRVMSGQQLSDQALLGKDNELTPVQRAVKRGEERALMLAKSLGCKKVKGAALSEIRKLLSH
ncbi:replication protein P [Halomonas sp. GXIMD04776]